MASELDCQKRKGLVKCFYFDEVTPESVNDGMVDL